MNYTFEATQANPQTTSQLGPTGRKRKPFSFPKAITPMQKGIISIVRGHGVHVMTVRQYKKTPMIFSTLGLFHSYQHPELVIIGLDVEVAHEILRKAHAFIKNGASISPWTNQHFIPCTTLKAVPIHAGNYSRFLRHGMWLYRSLGRSRPDPFPAIQILWPDAINDDFPWDESFDVDLSHEQKLLCSKRELRNIVECNLWGQTGRA